MSRLHMLHTPFPHNHAFNAIANVHTQSSPAIPRDSHSCKPPTAQEHLNLQSEGPTREKQACRSCVLRINVRHHSDHQT